MITHYPHQDAIIVTRTARRRKTSEERHEHLLDVAVRLFAARGYETTGTADIARAAGVSEPLLYKHFPSKRDLFTAVCHRCREQIAANFAQIRSECGNALEALELIWRVKQERHHRLPESQFILRLQAQETRTDPRLRRALAGVSRQVVDALADLVRWGQDDGLLRRDLDPELVAWSLHGFWKARESRLDVLGPDENRRVEERFYTMITRVLGEPAST